MSASKSTLHPQLNAFLDTISFSEGTSRIGTEDGYNVIVGGGTFKGYEKPPYYLIPFPKLGISSTAIGRYQILYRFAVHYVRELNLPDFSPVSQDKIALQLIRECKATQLIIDGQFRKAVIACASRWASFPGNAYGQRVESMVSLEKCFVLNGGKIQ